MMVLKVTPVPPNNRTNDFIVKAEAFVVILAAFAFVYFFFDAVLLSFGAILISVLLTVIATPIGKVTGHNRALSIALAMVVAVGALGGTGYLFGSRLVQDLQNIFTKMAAAEQSIRDTLQSSPLGKTLLSHLDGTNIPIADFITKIFSMSTSLVAGVVVAAVSGAFLAAQPSVYVNGLLALFPATKRAWAEETLIVVGNSLYRWLEGQLITMVLIGLFSAVATWAIGLPSPAALGLIAGVTEFIPYAGPVLAAIPAVLVAANLSISHVMWTLIAYILIHLTEGNILAPLIQRQLVYIPPAIMLLGISSITIVFGITAIFFAAPAVVVVFVLVKKIYVRESLHEPTSLPGETPQ